MRWTKEEETILCIRVKEGVIHKDIAKELGRTKGSVDARASKLKVKAINDYNRKTTEQYKKELPSNFLLLEDYINAYTKVLHEHLPCGHVWKANPSHILNNNKGSKCPNCSSTRLKTQEEYEKELPIGYNILDTYINTNTKVLHKHICGHTWKVLPSAILRGKRCPMCFSTFNHSIPAVVYLIVFHELNDLYKVGISNKYKERMKQFGYKPTIIMIRHFDIGEEAILLEDTWLNTLEPYLVNTGKLASGNTETFRLKEPKFSRIDFIGQNGNDGEHYD